MKKSGITRRDFVAASAGMAALAASGNYAHAQGLDSIKVGLIGCGGRGRDAVQNVVAAAPGVTIWSCGDAFKDRVDAALDSFKNLGEKNQVGARSFVGLDAYQKVVDTGANYIILATPPGYRPQHLRYAIEKGKHVFAEKPFGTCPAGIRSVLETARLAKEKGLGIVAGTQRRHQLPYVEIVKRIHDGALGEILAGQIYWMQGDIWSIPRESHMSDTEWALRNWQYFTALGGDHIVEQHIHNVDIMNWVMGGPPEKAYGVGGQQVRTDKNRYGHTWDHFGIQFAYPNGVYINSLSRQQPGTEKDSRVWELFTGTKGSSFPGQWIKGVNAYRYEGGQDKPYIQEHTNLINSIRAGKPLNEAKACAESTLAAIMAREAAYSGREITWEEILKSYVDLRPDGIVMGQPYPLPPVAVPGKYQFK